MSFSCYPSSLTRFGATEAPLSFAADLLGYTILYYTILYSTLLYSTLLYSTPLYYILVKPRRFTFAKSHDTIGSGVSSNY